MTSGNLIFTVSGLRDEVKRRPAPLNRVSGCLRAVGLELPPGTSEGSDWPARGQEHGLLGQLGGMMPVLGVRPARRETKA